MQKKMQIQMQKKRQIQMKKKRQDQIQKMEESMMQKMVRLWELGRDHWRELKKIQSKRSEYTTLCCVIKQAYFNGSIFIYFFLCRKRKCAGKVKPRTKERQKDKEAPARNVPAEGVRTKPVKLVFEFS